MRADRARARVLIVVLQAVLFLPVQASAAVTVFAAASLGDVMAALDEAWQARGGEALRMSLAATSTLARQIELGAPADIIVSANLAWMDRLEADGEIDAKSRRVLARNRLVLVARRGDAHAAGITEALNALSPRDRIAIGDPDHVPAGIYARAAFESLAQWDLIEPRLARTADVRAALALVARGEAPLGVVYATDARISGRVRVLATFPDDSHPPIVYPAALTRDAAGNQEAAALLAFMGSQEARPTWRRFGFAPPSGL